MIVDLGLDGAKLIFPKIFGDDRGFFFESYNEEVYSFHGVDVKFIQDNHSKSVKNTLRGLHYQSSPGQAKLVRVVRGKIFDAIVDIRPGSETFGKWAGAYLDDQKHGQIFVPNGFAHGFYVLSDYAEVCYKVSNLYNATTECSIRWNDPEVGIQWPSECVNPILSERDQTSEWFCNLKEELLK